MKKVKIRVLLTDYMSMASPALKCNGEVKLPDDMQLALEMVSTQTEFSEFITRLQNEYCSGLKSLFKGIPDGFSQGHSIDTTEDGFIDCLYVKNLTGKDKVIPAKGGTSIKICDCGYAVLRKGVFSQEESIGAEVADVNAKSCIVKPILNGSGLTDETVIKTFDKTVNGETLTFCVHLVDGIVFVTRDYDYTKIFAVASLAYIELGGEDIL